MRRKSVEPPRKSDPTPAHGEARVPCQVGHSIDLSGRNLRTPPRTRQAPHAIATTAAPVYKSISPLPILSSSSADSSSISRSNSALLLSEVSCFRPGRYRKAPGRRSWVNHGRSSPTSTPSPGQVLCCCILCTRRCARWRARPRWTTSSGWPTESSTPSSPSWRWSPSRSSTGYRYGTR